MFYFVVAAASTDVEDVGLRSPQHARPPTVTMLGGAGRKNRVLIEDEDEDTKDDLDAPVDEDGLPVQAAPAHDETDDEPVPDTLTVISHAKTTPPPVLIAAPEDLVNDTEGWLKSRKEAWRGMRQQRKRDRLEVRAGS